MSEVRENTGRMFAARSDRRRSPDYIGTINVRGELFRIAARRITPSEGGAPFMSLRLTPVEAQPRKDTVDMFPHRAEGEDAEALTLVEEPTPTEEARENLADILQIMAGGE